MVDELDSNILIFQRLKSLERIVDTNSEDNLSNIIAITGNKGVYEKFFSKLIQAERDLQQHLKFWMRELEGRWYKEAQKIVTECSYLNTYLEGIRNETGFGNNLIRLFELGYAALEVNKKRDYLIQIKNKVDELKNEMPSAILTKTGRIAVLYNIICYQYNLQLTKRELDYFTVSNEQFHKVFLKALASGDFYPEMAYSHNLVIK